MSAILSEPQNGLIPILSNKAAGLPQSSLGREAENL